MTPPSPAGWSWTIRIRSQGSASQELLATAYAAAGSEYVTRDGKGLAALHTLATTPEVSARAARSWNCWPSAGTWATIR